MDISLSRVAQAVAVLRGYEGRDIAALAEEELIAAQDAAAKLLRLAEVPVSVLAAEVARRSEAARGGSMARRHGHRNANRMVAKSTGGTAKHAHDLISTGALLGGGQEGEGEEEQGKSERAPRYPRVAAAYEAGQIASAKASLLIATLDHVDGGDEQIEQRVVARAAQLSLEDLRKVCLQITAMWDRTQWEKREQRMREERYLALKEAADGMVAVSGKLDPASAAPLMAWLDAQVRAKFQARREEGLGPAPVGEAGRMRVDALVDLARHGLRCDQPGTGVSTTVVVRLDHAALRTGAGMGSCDSLSTPLSASQIRRMAVDAGYLPIVLGGGSQPLDVGLAKRFFTAAQRIALAERDGGCAFCHAPVSWCDAHHITPWSRGGRSDLSNGVLLCTRCHHRIHDDGWEVRTTATEVWFTPPRHVDPERAPRLGGKAALAVPV